MATVRPFAEADCAGCAAALPRWFGFAEANAASIAALAPETAFVALEDGNITGFVAVADRTEEVAEIPVLAVAPAHHRQGAGARTDARLRPHAWPQPPGRRVHPPPRLLAGDGLPAPVRNPGPVGRRATSAGHGQGWERGTREQAPGIAKAAGCRTTR